MSNFKLGDKVTWSSQAAGRQRTKQGEIIEVVPQHRTPSVMKGVGMSRDHESYVVRAAVIDGSYKQRKRFRRYWPLVSKLQKVS